MDDVPKDHQLDRPGGWLPTDHRIQRRWLEGVVKHVDATPKQLHPVLKEFQALIETDTTLFFLINSMFEEVPAKKPYSTNYEKNHHVRDYKHMLAVLNHLITSAPGWSNEAYGEGFVGTPIHALFDGPMGTPSGFAAFLDPRVNAILKKMLNAWAEYLSSPESAQVLDRKASSWFGTSGSGDLAQVANAAAQTSLPLEEIYDCDPKESQHGFKSWDHFFTRTFRPGVRPVASPEDDRVIANPCESTPYKVAYDVKARDKFWVKGQPYSVSDMLALDELAEQFVGGTIYQAFLSALSYHRWHSPVNGKVVKTRLIDGTYYSEPVFGGLSGDDKINPMGENAAQGYLSAVATRAIIFIEADNPDIGLMCVLPVGMVEVSTCDVTVKEGQRVEKGDQLGMFHFGGSTCCVLFRRGVKVSGLPQPGRKENVPVRSMLAKVQAGA